ncbi:MAG TPA: DUF885 domain-containing protein [Thermoanaerobaculia bacterium]|nr:DUF885 domain-containing protein [Thermoanaerobaculia bacterium]
MQKFAVAFLASILIVSNLTPAELSASDLDKRRKALQDLLREHWEYTLRTQPEFASILGDKRYNDKAGDYSEAALRKDVAESRRFIRRVEAIDTAGFSEQEALDKVLMLRMLREGIENYELKEWEMPVTQISGLHLFAAQFPSLLTFNSAKDYDEYVKRMRAFPKQLDDTIAAMRKGMKDRLMPPKFLLEKVAAQAAGIAAQEPEKSPFAQPLESFPASVSEGERPRIHGEFITAIKESVLPAYKKFAAFVKDDYAPHGRSEVGMWALPDGVHRYNVRVRQSTTTKLTAEEIHQIGVREVARIEEELLGVAKRLGYNDLKAVQKAADENAALHAKSREQILELYRHYIDQMYAKLPQLFGRLPRAKVVVVATEAFREKEAPGAEYQPGAADGSRPGRVEVNTSEPQSRKTITMESTAYHEGVPGHHMQIAIAQELTGIPEFRKHLLNFTAYVEGWALYSERLGKEVGFYQDPWNDYGRLQDEMLRAIRLVVDTGLHAKKWTREQVVQYFHNHSAQDEIEIQNETDRYIVWPGQALGYKIGQLKILELREKQKQKLGDKFDIRAFHDAVLGAGAVPMDVLEQRMR